MRTLLRLLASPFSRVLGISQHRKRSEDRAAYIGGGAAVLAVVILLLAIFTGQGS